MVYVARLREYKRHPKKIVSMAAMRIAIIHGRVPTKDAIAAANDRFCSFDSEFSFMDGNGVVWFSPLIAGFLFSGAAECCGDGFDWFSIFTIAAGLDTGFGDSVADVPDCCCSLEAARFVAGEAEGEGF